jgi:hypothetical protein
MVAVDKAKGADSSPYDADGLKEYWRENAEAVAGVPTIHHEGKKTSK